MAELLAGDGEDEVGVAVRDKALDGALARPDAQPAAVDDGLAAHVDLEGVALAGEEAVDAAGDMREDGVGADVPRTAAAGRR